jgi:hypothetical protein
MLQLLPVVGCQQLRQASPAGQVPPALPMHLWAAAAHQAAPLPQLVLATA